MRILDHIFALHTAAVRSAPANWSSKSVIFKPPAAASSVRVGLVAFEAEADQPFDPKLHHVAGNEQPFEGRAGRAETAASGFTLQGKLLRPALVRLKEP